MKYYKISFHITPDESASSDAQTARDLLTYMAGEAGCETFEDTDQGVDGYAQQDLFDKQLLDNLLEGFPLTNYAITYSVEEAEDKDWNETWEEQGFEPISIDNRCIIYDALHPIDTQSASLPPLSIAIEAKMAFGTGTHNTTQMMVAAILDQKIKGKRILDCGTGTGILGITAAKCGAKEVVAYDIDEWSVENARHNAKLNNVDNMEILLGDAHVLSHVSGVFDVVLANINRNILLNDMKEFRDIMTDDGVLIISGFYEDDIHLLVEKASELGLEYVEKKQSDDWRCLIFHKA